MRPPVLEKRPQTYVCGGRTFEDPYFWLRDDKREDPDVLAHLQAEQSYADHIFEQTSDFKDILFKEFLSHTKETEMKPGVRSGDYEYFSLLKKGLNYPIHYRRSIVTPDAETQVLIDVNDASEGYDFYVLHDKKVSPDDKIFAYSVDTSGFEHHDIYFKDLRTGELLPDHISDAAGRILWGSDSSTIFYTSRDVANREFRVHRHTLGTPTEDDVIMWTEEDEKFEVRIRKTRNGRFLLVGSLSQVTSEWRYLDLSQPDGNTTEKLNVFQEREYGVEYSVDCTTNRWMIQTNADGAINGCIMSQPINEPIDPTKWTEVLAHDQISKVDCIDAFNDFLVVEGRFVGEKTIRILDLESEYWHTMEFDEPVYDVHIDDTKEFDTQTLRVTYESFTTPPTYYDYDMVSQELTMIKQTVVPNFDRSLYAAARWWATARDGQRVPLSVVWRKDKRTDEPQPVWIEAYGAYSVCSDPNFDSARVSLLDRGVIYVIAHVRGGAEMGKHWYENGKFLKKKNTFYDFIDSIEYLVSQGVTEYNLVCINGFSAGGLNVAAVTNERPDICKVVYAEMPWVDVIATMSDPNLPLTALEYEEWGHPDDEEYLEYMLSYSPYDNVKPNTAYPNMLVTCGLWDSRVAYWEPPKWVNKVREYNTDPNSIIMCTCTLTGHNGSSGRYDSLDDTARAYAFILTCLGITS